MRRPWTCLGPLLLYHFMIDLVNEIINSTKTVERISHAARQILHNRQAKLQVRKANSLHNRLSAIHSERPQDLDFFRG